MDVDMPIKRSGATLTEFIGVWFWAARRYLLNRADKWPWLRHFLGFLGLLPGLDLWGHHCSLEGRQKEGGFAWRGRILWHFAALMIGALGLPSLAGMALGAVQGPQEQEVRNFLASPQKIERLIFERRDYPDIPRPEVQAIPTGVVISLSTSEYSVIWQEGAFWMEAIPPGDYGVTNFQGEIVKPDLHWACGFVSGKMWTVRGNRMTYLKHELQYEIGKTGLTVYDNNRLNLSIALEAIDLGISHLMPGTLNWSGTNWTAKATTGEQMAGYVSFGKEDERLLRMDYKIEGDLRHFVVTYLYDGDPPSGSKLPWHFKRTAMSGSTNTLVEAEIRIKKLVVSQTDVKAEVMKLETDARTAVLKAGKWPIFEQTTEGTFWVDKRHQVQKVTINEPPHIATVAVRSKRLLVLSCLIVLSLFGLILVFLSIKHKPAT